MGASLSTCWAHMAPARAHCLHRLAVKHLQEAAGFIGPTFGYVEAIFVGEHSYPSLVGCVADASIHLYGCAQMCSCSCQLGRTTRKWYTQTMGRPRTRWWYITWHVGGRAPWLACTWLHLLTIVFRGAGPRSRRPPASVVAAHRLLSAVLQPPVSATCVDPRAVARTWTLTLLRAAWQLRGCCGRA